VRIGFARGAKLVFVYHQSPFDPNEIAGEAGARIQTRTRPKLSDAKAAGQDRRHQYYPSRAHSRIDETIISCPAPADKKKSPFHGARTTPGEIVHETDHHQPSPCAQSF